MPGFGNRASINRYDQDLRKMGDFGGFKRLDWDLKKYAKSPNLCRFWIDFDHVEKNCHVLPILYPSSPCSSMSCVKRPGLASILAIRWRRVRRSLRHVEPLLLSTARRVGPQKGWKIPVKFAANDWGRFPTILIVVMYSSKVRVKTVQVACLHEKIHYLKSNVFLLSQYELLHSWKHQQQSRTTLTSPIRKLRVLSRGRHGRELGLGVSRHPQCLRALSVGKRWPAHSVGWTFARTWQRLVAGDVYRFAMLCMFLRILKSEKLIRWNNICCKKLKKMSLHHRFVRHVVRKLRNWYSSTNFYEYVKLPWIPLDPLGSPWPCDAPGSIHIQRLVSERIAPDAAVMKRLVAVHAPGMGFSANIKCSNKVEIQIIMSTPD